MKGNFKIKMTEQKWSMTIQNRICKSQRIFQDKQLVLFAYLKDILDRDKDLCGQNNRKYRSSINI